MTGYYQRSNVQGIDAITYLRSETGRPVVLGCTGGGPPVPARTGYDPPVPPRLPRTGSRASGPAVAVASGPHRRCQLSPSLSWSVRLTIPRFSALTAALVALPRAVPSGDPDFLSYLSRPARDLADRRAPRPNRSLQQPGRPVVLDAVPARALCRGTAGSRGSGLFFE